ncbi:MAG: DUF2207 domain-containing protein [Clostridiales bacterium]|uniref:DUF2207 domain-containing protein n=1 Tax=Clostridium sp. N3C TaxID=1776758 RepID=UPI00092E1E40|nr:DUF2207 domain-containing protein [Clostridium sp. N3C]NLZ48101.1 DUF2207 domain-containing protein [Clostridiales bacterium]SCN21594.1 hypothetical protein N3C_0326 [Clostridium sp. N3C]
MKKVVAVLLFFSIFLSPFIVKADSKSYTIENLVVNSTILRNGDVYVEEELTYYFNGDFNGIYRNLSKKGADNITISEVLVEDNKGNVITLREDKGSNNNYYELDNSSSLSKIKIFSKSSNERKTFIFKYTIHGAVVKREDIGELYWAFYEVENNIPVNTFELNLSLNSADFDMSVFKHWGYVDGKNLIVNYNEKGFQINGSNLTGKLGVKVNFQPDYLDIPITKKGQGAIIGLVILAVVFIFVFAIVVYIMRKNKKFKAAVNSYRARYMHFNGDLVTMAPSDMAPALVDLLINENYVSSSAISATLFYLCHKGYYTLENPSHIKNEFSSKKNNQDLVFKRNYQMAPPETAHLKYFMRWMSKYERNGVLALKTIRSKVQTRSGALDYKTSNAQFDQTVKREAKELGFYVNIENKTILSNEYYDEKLKWKAYKKYLMSYVNRKNMEPIESIDEMLIYASVLIGSQNQLKKLLDSVNNSVYSSNSFNDNLFYYYYPFFMTNYSLWGGINYEANKDYSSGDGGGFGGFSSGSDFGGGGGGGSGAF